MQYRVLGKTGIQVSVIAFGAGPISTLMVGEERCLQTQVVRHALECGINWFDTAATYGQGASEISLGLALKEIAPERMPHIATKVRFSPEDLSDILGAARRSLTESLRRLQVSNVTLLQLHNSITPQRGDEPTSIAPQDVLGPNGVAQAFAQLRDEGYVRFLGFTGLGHPDSMAQIACSGRFETIQVPYHMLNPSAGRCMPAEFMETNYGNIIDVCARQSLGVFVIRVLAGGALAGNEPSPHTYKTPFFPLDLYLRDRQRADELVAGYLGRDELARQAIRFSITHTQVQAAIIGFASNSQIDEAVKALPHRSPITRSRDAFLFT